MHIHEYQAKNLLQKYGIMVPFFAVASCEKEVVDIVQQQGLEKAVLKIQVHAGGRGKAGGVRFAESAEQIVRMATEMLGMKIVNQQTGPYGMIGEKILISSPVTIEKEYYVGAIIDRAQAKPMLIVSPEGGMEIEEIAAKKPEKLLKVPLELTGNIRGYHLLEIIKFMGWKGAIAKQGKDLISRLAKAFIETDASLLEINPLVLTPEGNLQVLDAKFTLDDNALYRQPAIAQWYDASQHTKNEVLAKEYDLSYVGLEGEIGCMVNGAGLAMATMDIIDYYGGRPANFLDVGGGASKEKVAHGFKIILLDPRVKCIFVNIFGGIMDCGILAQGIVEATKEDGVENPLVIRMEGTNEEKGKEILEKSGLDILAVDTMEEGALKAVEVAKR